MAAAAPAAAPTGAGTDPGTDTATGGQGTGGDPAEEARRRGREESEVRLLLLDAVLGQQDAAWLCAFDHPDDGPLDGIAAVARSAGWWWPYENVAVVCERPSALHRDEAGRLDRADGPALAYPDGFALYSWRGMPVPGEFLEELAGLTPDRIRLEENAELRRVMLEHYGYDRYLAESGAVPLHRDETGVLWSIPMPGDENVVMVEVVNSTPEPDGTSRTYWLRVPRPRPRPARASPGPSASAPRPTPRCARPDRPPGPALPDGLTARPGGLTAPPGAPSGPGRGTGRAGGRRAAPRPR